MAFVCIVFSCTFSSRFSDLKSASVFLRHKEVTRVEEGEEKTERKEEGTMKNPGMVILLTLMSLGVELSPSPKPGAGAGGVGRPWMLQLSHKPTLRSLLCPDNVSSTLSGFCSLRFWASCT